MKKNKIIRISLISLILPNIVFAGGILDLMDSAYSIVYSLLIPMAFSLCLLYFFWGMVKYIKDGASSDKAAEEGKRIMLWGIVGLFVAVSVWGIVSLIKNELGIPDIENVVRPDL